MSEMFPTNRGRWSMHILMASAHRYAIDYIEQAPVVVLAVARGSSHVSRRETPLSKNSSARNARAKLSCAT